MKKKILRIFSIFLSLSVILSTILLPDIVAFAQSANSYNAQLLSLPVSEKRGGSGFEYTYEEQSTALAPEFNGGNLTINGWSSASTTNNTENYIYVATTESNSSNTTDQVYSFDEGKAVMFYVKTAIGTPANELFIQLVTSTAGDEAANGKPQWIMLAKAADVHYLHKGDTEWTTLQTVESTVAGTSGNIIIPSGFEGWIRIPYDSLNIKEGFSTKIHRMDFYPKCMGSKYTAQDISIGNFMFVDKGAENHTNVMLDGVQKSLLVELPCHVGHLLNPVTVNGATVLENETAITQGYTYAVSDKTAAFTVNDSTPASEAVMAYLRLPLDGDSKVSVKINNKLLKENSELFALNRGDLAFKSVNVDADGNITLEDGFEGYVLIPTSAYDGLKGNTITNVNLEFEKQGAVFGSILLSDNTNPELIVRMDYDRAPVYLLKDAYYKGTMLETENSVTSSIANNTYYNVGEKVTDKEFSIGIDDGYYYEMSPGSMEDGTYKIGSNILPSYTGTTGTGLSSEIRPWNNPNAALNVVRDDANTQVSISVNNESSAVIDGVYDSTVSNSIETHYAIIKPLSAPTLEPTGSLMFYVKHSDATKPIKMLFGKEWHILGEYCKYYLLPSGAVTWQERTAEDVNTTNANHKQGYFELPADFEGWVRIPASNFILGKNYYSTASAISKIYVFPYTLGGEYGSLTFSNFITVAEGDKNYTTIKIGQEEISLTPPTKAYNASKVTGLQKDSGVTQSPTNNAPISVELDAENNSFTISANASSTHATISGGVYSADNPIGSSVYSRVSYSTAPNFNVDGSLMFYVKHNDATKDIKIAVGNGWYIQYNETNYYLLQKGSVTWQKNTAEKVNNKFGLITIPARFDGWVRIPTTALKMGGGAGLTNQSAMNKLYIFPNAIGGDYGSLTVSNVNVIGETDDRVFFNYGDDVKVPLNTNIEVDDSGNFFKIIMGTALNQKVFTSDAAVGDYNSTIALKNEATLNTNEAFMFYARQSGRTASQISVELADAGMKMIAGAKYYTYDSQNKTWMAKTALDGGKIEIAGGYSGWIRIPYSSLTDSSNKTDPDGFSFGKILVAPYQLGSSYGNIKIGSFMIVNHGEDALVTMRVNKAAEAPLTVREAYTAKTMVPSDVLGIGTNARSVVAKNLNKTVLEGGYLYSVESNYKTVTMDETNALEIAVSGGLIENEDGIMVYVKIPDTKENAVIFGDAFKPAAGAKYYILNAGNDSVWTEKTATADGTLPIPAGFDGYIRVPFDSMANMPSGEITKIIFGFEKIGEDYGAPLFGTFMLSDNTGYNFYGIYVDVIDYSQSLIQPDYYEGYVMQGEATVDGGSDLITVTKTSGNTLTPDIPEGYSYVISAASEEVNLTEKEKTPRISFAIDNLYRSKLSSSGAIMFYVDIKNSAENTMYLEVIGDITVTAAAGSKFSVLQSGNAYWEEHVTDGNGYLPFAEGFSGWVRVPFNSLKDSKGVALKENIKQINFTFKNVGGNYGAPQVASIIMLTNNGEFGKIKFSGYTDKVTLYGANQKTEYTRDDIAIWDSVIDPFVTYDIGDSITVKPDIDKTVPDEVNNVFSGEIVNGITPFASKGIEYTSEKALDSHGDHYPRVSVAAPFSLKDTAGVAMYLKIPDNGAEVNSAFIQMKTTGNKWVSIKKEFMIPVLQKGETDWEYIFVQGQRVQFPAGFEGYVYIPLEAMVTHPTATGINVALNTNEVISNVIIGVDRYGGSVGTVTLGGMFLSRNGILSHNGAYVDGDTVCRDVFLGTAVNEDTVRYSIFDVPGQVGAYLKDVPVPTAPEYVVDLDNIKGHSVDVLFEAYPGANRYRVDVYKINAVPDLIAGTYYEYVCSKWTTTRKVTIDGLATGTSYTVVVSAFKDDVGLAIYALCPARPEGSVVGNMHITDIDTYKYDWVTNESEEYEWEYETIYEDVEGDNGNDSTTKTERVKKVLRRKKQGGMQIVPIIVIIVVVVVVLAAATVLAIILIKKKRRNR